jgi:hypothetical protein
MQCPRADKYGMVPNLQHTTCALLSTSMAPKGLKGGIPSVSEETHFDSGVTRFDSGGGPL